jgi:hypothetical protein
MIHVHADPSETWVGLIPNEGVFPGTTHHFTGGFNLVYERLT